mmetsp:Transcript_104294/g.185396  ORF Transcript_104294/g.185396 Transcript_104294/m.185396 type:complete len:252 (+) Transcript_104294:411-1166(+)
MKEDSAGRSSAARIFGKAGTSQQRSGQMSDRNDFTPRLTASRCQPCISARALKPCSRTFDEPSWPRKDSISQTSSGCPAAGGRARASRRSTASFTSPLWRSSMNTFVASARKTSFSKGGAAFGVIRRGLGGAASALRHGDCPSFSACCCSATSANAVGRSSLRGRISCQPFARRSKRSFSRQRTRGEQLLFCTMTLMRSSMWHSMARYCHSGLSKQPPTTVRRAAKDSKASGVGFVSSSSMMAMPTLPASI